MSCKFHPNAATVGACAECGQDFCAECAVPVKRQGDLCLACGAVFAKKQITQSYVATGLGVVAGFLVINDAGFLAPILGAYSFFALFWGWHYGGKVWLGISRALDTLFSGIPLAGPVFLFVIRLTFAAAIGGAGGGIIQFMRCREIVKRYASLSGEPAPAAA